MTLFKQNFAQARMNKDLDERIVPNGQYRDALNIQISTSDGGGGGAVGTAQTLMGNVKHSTIDALDGYYEIPDTSTVVGCIENRATDKVYYFVSSGDLNNATGEPAISKDYIMQYDTVAEKHKYVFVDIFKVKVTVAAASSSSDNFLYIPKGSTPTSQGGAQLDSAAYNLTGVRIGMYVTGTFGDNNITLASGIKVSDIIYNSGNSSYKIYLEQHGASYTPPTGVDVSDNIVFESERVLNFSKNYYISSINIIDDFLLWTDGINEPKKINISRSIAGTGGLQYLKGGTIPVNGYDTTNTILSQTAFEGDYPFFHTRLVSSVGFASWGGGSLSIGGSQSTLVVTQSDNKRAVYVDESHVSVIKPAPTQPLNIDMYRTSVPRLNDSAEENPLNSTISGINGNVFFVDNTRLESGDEVSLTLDSGVDFRNGDRLKLIRQDNDQESDNAYEQYDILVEVVDGGNANSNSLDSNYAAKIISISPDIQIGDNQWFIAIDAGESLFEFKFPRFSYRYRYVDGEYSSFAPFSKVAFLTDAYDFAPEQAHNLGMINQVRNLKLEGYHPQEFDMPQDVVEIDLLYKETNNPTVYIVKTIKPTDGHPIWPTQGETFSTISRGEYILETDTIYNTVPSNQLLRPYDNVPRSAVTQEISANRLIYGNYTQGYTVDKEPDIRVGYESTKTSSVDADYAPPSVKSDRSYQIGVVFSDKYGRETPVITSKNATVKVPHSASKLRNRISVNMEPISASIPSWAEYFSYYVKESSDEYYNMTMDRWYYTSDGNIWLSFPSSERNKITEESYITLKKYHGSDVCTDQKARYKVIDISNSVPTEVKTKNLELGLMKVDPEGEGAIASALGDGTQGYVTVDSSFILVDASEFEAIFGENMQVKTPDNLRIQFFGPSDNKASKVYNVAHFAKATTSQYRIAIEGLFGPDCEFALGEAQNHLLQRADLEFAMYADELTDKAEHTGRFFVKVYKDELLEQYILSQTAEDTRYEIIASWGLRYINNNGYRNAGTFGSTPTIPFNAVEFNSQTQNGAHQSYSQLHPTNQTAAQHPTEYNWSNHSGITNEGGTYFWGGGSSALDGTKNAGGLTAADLDSDDDLGSMAALADRADGDANEYWNKMAGTGDFFIDGCTAYSWTAKGNQSEFADDDDTPGNMYSSTGVENTAEYFPTSHTSSSQAIDRSETAAQEEDQVAPEFYSHGKLANNTGYRRGQPSRGIWADGRCMDISWTGMGLGHVSGQLNNNQDYPIAHQLKNVQDGGPYKEAYKFIKTFVTPGTKFRFSRDPDSTIYTVGSFRNFEVANGGDLIGWANQSDKAGFVKNESGEVNTDDFDNSIFFSGTNKYTGVFGIRNFWTNNQNDQYYGHNLRQRWTITVDPKIGSTGSKYNPTKGTHPTAIYSNTDSILGNKFRRALRHDGGIGDAPSGSNYPSGNRRDVIEIIRPYEDVNSDHFSPNAGVWETEPKDVPDLDIYYQASGLNPIRLSTKTQENIIPIGSTFKVKKRKVDRQGVGSNLIVTHTVTGWTSERVVSFSPAIGNLSGGANSVTGTDPATGEEQQVAGDLSLVDIEISSLTIDKPDGSSSVVHLRSNLAAGDTSASIYGSGNTPLEKSLGVQKHFLNWNNCWAFGNGVESDRVRDDFNAPRMDNGVKASAEIKKPLKSETRKHGMIWSGIYNSTSGVNDINQFIQAEPITKDLNPIYGSIQRLINRNNRLVIFCEDKVLRAETNRDLLFNADGNAQVVASNKVVGSAVAYQGNYGIGKSPGSIAQTPNQIYFVDTFRGHVLALSGEGVRSISDKGMRDYFASKFSSYSNLVIGSYDEKKSEYNLTISKKHNFDAPTYFEQTTVCFSEMANGWTSFRSFTPSSGASLNNNYYTFFNGHLWKHHANETRNNFYGTQYASDITVLFNDSPEGVKSFGAINYEGSQARVTNFDLVSAQMFNNNYASTDSGASEGLAAAANVNDGEFHNLEATVNGWYIDNITTNLQEGGEVEFKEKEGKWFGYPQGLPTTLSNLDEKEFSVQGLGSAGIVHSNPSQGESITITVANNTSTTFQGADGSGGAWDSTAD